MNKESKWAEIRCDHLDEEKDSMFWDVDAWETGDDDEEGKVIACIDELSGRIVYKCVEAMFDPYAQEVIMEKASECRKRHPFSVEELESALRSIVDYTCEDWEYAGENLSSMGIPEDMARFFGYEPETEL